MVDCSGLHGWWLTFEHPGGTFDTVDRVADWCAKHLVFDRHFYCVHVGGDEGSIENRL